MIYNLVWIRKYRKSKSYACMCMHASIAEGNLFVKLIAPCFPQALHILGDNNGYACFAA